MPGGAEVRRMVAVLAACALVSVVPAFVGPAAAGPGGPPPEVAVAVPTASACDPTDATTCTLRELADLAGIRIGASAEATEVLPGPYAETLAREFNALTPENAMKWYTTNPAAGVFEFADADAVVGFADANDMAVRAHTLVWTQDTFTPAWVLASGNGEQLAGWVAQHVTTVAGRYAGKVPRWDVINEPLETLGTGLSDSVFHRLLPPGWMAGVFGAVRAVDPDAELWINEYGTDWVPGKHEALVALVRGLLAGGAPLDGVGLQVHRPSAGGPDRAVFERQLRDFTDLGLAVAITELDIPIPPVATACPGGFCLATPASPTDAGLVAQAVAYRTIVEACLAVAGCEEITVWGVTDANTWLDGLGIFPTPTRPLLFDDGYAPKPAYFAVRDALAAFVMARNAPPPGPPDDIRRSTAVTPVFTG